MNLSMGAAFPGAAFSSFAASVVLASLPRLPFPLKSRLRSPLILFALAGLVLLTADCTNGATKPDPGGRLFVAPGGSDAGVCSEVAPCASLDRAFRVAVPGQVVVVGAGSYPVQTLRRDPAKTSGAEVVFVASGSVTLAGFVSGEAPKVESGARHFELRGVRISGYVDLNWGTEDVTIRDVDASAIEFTSVRDVRVFGGDFGPRQDAVSHINACGVAGCYASEDVLIDGALFHDYTITYAAKHSECLMIWPARRVTIRNSTFRNCTDFDLLVKPYNTGLAGLPGAIVLENNFFDEPIIGEGCFCTRGGSAVAITQGGGEAWSDVQIRYNSSLGEIRVDKAISNVSVKGNVARKTQSYSCQTNVTFSHNVWSGTRCSPTDKTAPLTDLFLGSTSGAGFDLSLRAGAAAVNAGDPASFPTTDGRGTARPQGGVPDAGAHEQT